LDNNTQVTSTTPFLVTNNAISGVIPTFTDVQTSSFQSGVHAWTPDDYNRDLIVVDLDGDGKPDVVKQEGNTIKVNRNATSVGSITSSSFGNFISFSHSGSNINDFDFADINNDGKLDIVVVSNYLAVFLNNSSGPGNISFSTPIELYIGGTITRLQLEDINGDGFIDFLYSSPSNTVNASNINIRRNIYGTISSTLSTIVSTTAHKFFETADVNSDGKPDLLVSSITDATNGVNVYLNTSTSGTISFSTPTSVSTVANRNLSVVDFDLDGDVDFLAIPGSLANQKINKLYNVSGTLTSNVGSNNEFTQSSGKTMLYSGNIDGDDKVDAIAAVFPNLGYACTQYSLFRNLNSSSYDYANSQIVSIPTNNTPHSVIVDIDGDNKPDIINARGYYSSFVVMKNTTPTTLVSASPTSISGFSTCVGTQSTSQTTSISGSGLTANMVVTAPTGYEVSLTSGSGYTSSLTLTQSGGVVNATTIYVRLSASASAGATNGNLTITSTGATTVNVALTGTVNAMPTVAINPPASVCSPNTVDLTNSAVTVGSTDVQTFTFWTDYGATSAIADPTAVSAAGTYYIQGTSSAGCSVIEPVTVSVGSTITSVSLTLNERPCGATATGSANVTVNGAGTFTYTWTRNGVSYAASPSNAPTNLSAGTYIVTVSNGCGSPVASNSLAISNGSVMTITSTSNTNNTCYGGTAGTITAVISGGTAPRTITATNTSVTPNVSYSVAVPTTGTTYVINNLPAGNYTVSANDISSCTPSVSNVIVTQPNQLAVTASKTDATCNGISDGTATATVSGGTASYTYQWLDGSSNAISGATSATATSLAAGTYSVRVTDACGAQATSSTVTIAEPTTITIASATKLSYNGVDLSCATATDGQITVTASGGTGTLQYSKNNGTNYQASNVFTGLAAGTYTIKVKDANNCTSATTSVTITAPTALTGTSAVTSAYNGAQISCPSSTDGEITVTAAGGTGTKQYSKDNGSTWQASNVFMGLAAGTYQMKIKDDNNCESSAIPTTITAPAVLALTSTQTNITCNGGNSGAIDLTVTGGSGTKTYLWDDGAASTTQDITGLTAATYTVTVTDGNSCTATTSVTITQLDAITATATATAATCNGTSTGSIAVTAATGGAGTYEYSIDNGTTWQSGASFNTLAASTYQVSIRDAVNTSCVIDLDGSTGTAVGQPAVLAFGTNVGDIITTPVVCFGDGQGSISVTGTTGGTTPYTYSIDGTAFVASPLLSVVAGTYTLTVKDANGCTETTSVTVDGPTQAVSIAESNVDVLCFGGSTGEIDLTVSGGTSPYTYAWTGPGSFTSTSADLSGLVAGDYTVVVTDANGSTGGCTSTETITISEPASAVSIAETNVDVLCFGGSTGEIDLTVSGGTSPYTYAWTGPGSFTSTSADLSGLVAGDYTVVVTDANGSTGGCTSTETVTISELAAALVASNTQVDNTCFGGTAGSITASATGGTLPYEYKIGTGSYSATATFGSLAAGAYTVTVKDANGCTSITSATITEPAILAATVSKINVNCNGVSNGSITIASPTGGAGTYEYTLDGGTTWTAGLTNTGLAAGTYNVQIRDAVNTSCVIDLDGSSNTVITEPVILSATVNTTNVSCNAGTNGTITVVTPAGGTGYYNYSIDGGTTWQASNTFSGLAAGSYNVQIRDVNAPFGATAGVINDNTNNFWQSFTATSTSNLTAIKQYLNGANNTFTATLTIYSGTGIGGTLLHTQAVTLSQNGTVQNMLTLTSPVSLTSGSVYTYRIVASGAMGVALSHYGASGPDYTGGQYSPQANSDTRFQIYTSNATACSIDLDGSSNTTITEPAVLAATITSQTDVDCNGNSTGSVEVTATSGTGTSPYEYKIGTGSYSSTNTFGTLAVGTYTVTVKDANGCETPVSVTITEPDVLSATVTVTNIDCFGADNGEINITSPLGGYGTYEYSIDGGSTWQSTGAFTGLAPATTYNVQIRDAAHTSCVIDLDGNGNTTTVTEPDVLSATVTVTNVTCNGVDDGEINITSPLGGYGTYEYSIDGGSTWQSTGAFTGIAPATTYDVQIRDAAHTSCVIDLDGNSNTTTVTEPDVLSATVTVTNVTCNGVDDGEINITSPLGGYGTYEYSIDGGSTWQSTGAFTGLAPATTYDVQIRDAAHTSCVIDIDGNGSTTTVTEPATLSATNSQVNNTCFGGTAGSITASATGGTAPYEYKIGTGTYSATATFGSLAAGSYIITVKDANGCETTTTATITEPNILAATITAVNATCNGLSNGSITLSNPSGGLSSYDFTIDGGTTWSSATSYTGLTAGTYDVQIRDFANPSCIIDLDGSSNTVITQPGAITVTSTAVDVLCNGANTGSINITVAGGTSPYTYAWSNGVYSATTENISTLYAGTYTVTVTDANGCTSSAHSKTISEPTLITGSGAVTSNYNGSELSCVGSTDGTITVNASGGTGTLNYSIDEGNYQTSNIFTGLAAGLHVLDVKDANGCIVLLQAVTITAPALLEVVDEGISDASCSSTTDGAVPIYVSGGTGAYTYAWSGPSSFASTIEDISNLLPGTYDVTVTDANGCIATGSYTVASPPAATVSLTKTDALCHGSDNGTITATLGGGTPPYGNFVWTLNGATYGNATTTSTTTTATLTNALAGTYTLTFTDAAACPYTSDTIVVGEPAVGIDATATVSGTPTCIGATAPVVTFTGSLGTAPYTFAYRIGLGQYQYVTTSSGNSVTLNAPTTAAGTFNYALMYVQDANGCTTYNTGITDPTAEVVVNALPTVSAGIDQTVCNGTSVTLTGAGATTYTWDNSATNATAFTATNNTTSTTTTTYTVTGTDANGCVNTDQMVLTVNPTPTVASTTDEEICAGSNTTAVNFTGTVSGTQFNWTNSSTAIGLAASGTGDITSFVGTNTTSLPIVSTITVTPVAPVPANVPSNPTALLLYAYGTINTGRTITYSNINLNGTNSTIASVTAGSTVSLSFTYAQSGSNLQCPGCVTQAYLGIGGTSNAVWCKSGNLNGTASVSFTAPASPGTYYIVQNGTYEWNCIAQSFTTVPSNAVAVLIVGGPIPVSCYGTPDTFTITVNPAATANAGIDATICSTDTKTLSGIIGGGASSLTWSTSGDGTFSDASSATATYTPGSADVASGTVTLTITTDDPTGPCNAVSDAMTLTINPAAVVNAGNDDVICSTTSTYTLAGTYSGSTSSITWTTSGTGTFDDTTSTTAIYTPSAADISAGTVALIITSNNPVGPCNAVSDTMVLTISPATTADAGTDATICSNDTYTLAGNIGGSATTLLWTTAGSGTFDDATSSTAIYAPSSNDINAGSVVLTLTGYNTNGPCASISDDITVIINPEAIVSAGNDQEICAGSPVVLSSSVSGGAISGSWTSTGTGSFDDATSLTATYTPSAADKTAGTVTLTLTSADPTGPCNAVSDQLVVTIQPTPVIAAITDTICSGETFTVTPANGNGNVVANGTTYTWSAPTVNGITTTNGGTNQASISDVLENTTNQPINVSYTVTPSYQQPIPTVGSTYGGGIVTYILQASDPGYVNGQTTMLITSPVDVATGVSWYIDNVAMSTTSGTGIGDGLANTNSIITALQNLGANPLNYAAGKARNYNGGGYNDWYLPSKDEWAKIYQNVPNLAGASTGYWSSTRYNSVRSYTPLATNLNDYSGNGWTGGYVRAVRLESITPSNLTCTGNSFTVTVTVNPTPSINDDATTICSASAFTYTPADGNGSGNIVPTGTTYSWTAQAVSGITGISNGSNKTQISDTLTNTTDAAIDVTYTVTPTSAEGCAGAPFDYVVTVYPTPRLNSAQTLTAVCTVANNVAYTATSPTVATQQGSVQFDWSRAAINGITESASSVTNDPAIAETLTNTTNAPTNVTYVYTITANGCSDTSHVNVTVNPTPTVDADTSQTLCNNGATASVTFTSAFAVSGTTYSWTNDTPSIGLASFGSGDITSFTAINTSGAPITATIVVTPTANNCDGATQTFTITVNPTPNVNPVNTQTVCNQDSTSAIQFTGTIPTGLSLLAYEGFDYPNNTNIANQSGGFGWAGNWQANYYGNSSMYVYSPGLTYNGLNVTGNKLQWAGPGQYQPHSVRRAIDNPNSGIVYFQFISDFNSTSGGTDRVDLNFNGTTLASIGGNNPQGQMSIMAGGQTINSGYSVFDPSLVVVQIDYNNNTTKMWVNPTISSFDYNNPGTAAAVYNNSIPFNQISLTFRSGAVIDELTVYGGTSYNWTNDNTATGLAASGIGNIPSFIGTNTTNAPIVSNITVTPSLNGCIGTPITTSITVNPIPTVDTTASQTLCKGELISAIPFTSTLNVSGTQFDWTNDNTAIGLGVSGTGDIAAFTALNTTNAPLTANIIVTPSTSSCIGTPDTFAILVNPVPTVDASTDQTLCNGESITAIPFTSALNVSGTQFDWTNDTPSIGLSATGSGDITSFTAVNATNAPITAMIIVTPSTSNCVGIADTILITVKPTPTVDAISSQTLCAGETTTAVNFTSQLNVQGTTYSWTNDNTNIGLTASDLGDISAFISTNATSNAITGNIIVTPSANGCIGDTIQYYYTVNATPAIADKAQTICTGSTFTISPVDGVSNDIVPNGTQYTWTVSSNAVVTGQSDESSLQTSISQTLTNPSNAPEVVTYTVTPIITNNGVTCTGNTFDIVVTVNPTMTIADETATICSGATFAVTPANGGVNNNVLPVGTWYEWVVSQNNDVTGQQDDNTHNPNISQTLVNTSSATQQVIYTVTPYYNNAGQLCSGQSFTVTVNVLIGAPSVNVGTDQTICANGSANYNVIVTDATLGSWGTNGTGVISPNVTNTTVTYTPSASDISPIKIYYTALNSCGSNADTALITLTPLASPVASTGTTNFCLGSTTTLVNTVSGGTWSTNNMNIATVDANGVVSSVASGTAIITYTYSANGCTQSVETAIIVNPLPIVTPISGPNNVCAGLSINLTNATSGGSWTTSNASIATVNPSTGLVTGVAQGAVTITYTVTNGNGCVNSTSSLINVGVGLTAMVPLTGNNTICAGTTTQVTHPLTGGIWYSSNPTVAVVSNTGLVTGISAGTTIITYEVTNSAGCAAAVNLTMTVNPQPIATISASGSTIFCEGGSVTLTASPGTSYAWNTGDTTASISIYSSGTYNVIVTGANGCTTAANPKTVVVNATPIVSITANGATSFCQGGSVVLTATPGSQYLWSDNTTNQSITLTSSGNYSVTVTNNLGCTGTSNIVSVNVATSPTASITASATTICVGASTTLTANGGSGFTYLWSNGATTQAITVSPSATTTYTVSVTNANGCTSASAASQVITVNPLPVASITASASAVCVGTSATLTASAGSSYLWSTGATTAAITVTPTSTTSYSVTVTNANGCSATSAVTTIGVNPLPVVAAGNDAAICEGSSTSLVASGAATYVWSPSTGLSATNTASVTANPTATTTYTVTGTDANGCVNTDQVVVTVSPLPTASITASAATICVGASTTLTANGGTGFTYLWSNGATTQAITVSPSATTTYTVSVTNANGCTSASAASQVITVNPLPVASISASASAVCVGTSATLTASAGSSYLWSTGETTAAITVTPTSTTSYSVTVTNANGCSATSAVTTIGVNPLPVVAAGNDAAICAGSSTSLVASGAATYVWSPSTGLSATNTASVTANPTATTTYTVTGTDANGCVNTDQVVVTVSPLPTASITASAATICVGASTTLTANGGTGFTYLWSNGATTQAITVSPSATTTYTVSVTNANGCTSASAASQVITVNPLPVASISASASAVCVGTSATLTASAGSSYLWSTGETTAAITVTPTSTTSYSVTVTNANGCSATSAVTTIGVNPLPVVAAISGPNNVCSGLSITLTNATAGGTWSSNNTALATVNPTTGLVTGIAQGAVTITYSVTNGNGCVNSSSTVVNVGVGLTAMVPLTGNNTMCAGTTTQVSHPLVGGIWYSSNPTIAVVSNTGLVTGISAGSAVITYEITNNAGCASAVNMTMTVNAQPTASITASGPTTFCQGGSVTLTATPGSNYAWNIGGPSTSSINVSSSGTYNVIITGANGCTTAANAVTVVVNPTPMVLITPSGPTTFCQGGSVTLTASAGASYTWNGISANTQSVTVSATGNYSVTVTNSLGCTGTSAIMPVSVGLSASASIIASGPTTLCQGGSVTLIASSGTSYSWSGNGAITQSNTVSTAGVYTVTVTNSFGCSATSAPVTVTVNPLPVASISASGPTTFCQGGNVILTASAGTAYSWSGNGLSAGTQSVTINNSGTYQVTVTNASGCVSTSASVTVTVNALPLAAISNVGPTTFCQGGSVTLLATPGTSYLWSGNNATTQSNTISTSGNYTVTVMNAAGCTATSTPTTVTVNPIPVATIIPSGPTTFCQGGNVVLTAGPATGVTYLWSNGLTTPTITVNTTGNYSVVVTSLAGCSATATAVPVTVNALPLAAISTIGATTFCQGGSVTLMATPGTSYLWSGNNATTQSNTVSAAGNYTVTVMNAAGCTATSTPVAVTVNALPAVPVVVASGPTAICPSGSVTLTAPAGFTTYSWNNGATSPSITVNIAGNYKVTVTNANGCSATSALTVVTVGDNTAPVIVSPANITLNLTAGCSVSNLNLGTPVVTDNCLIAYVSNNAPYTFPIGTTVVTWTALDASGNVATANQTITIVDTIAPVISVPATVTVAANNGCDATGVFIGDATATDNCTITTITNDAPTVFPLGTTVVTWIATDASGNADTLTQNIVVEDLMAPVIAANNQTVTLDLTGNVLIDTLAINTTANDNCGVASVVYSQVAFDCSNVGANTITITVTDNSGNVTSQQITVTVLPSGVDDDFDGIDDACDDQIDTLAVVIPSGFTPNADNINDYFQILGLESYASKTLEVFNRYGNQVYESTNYANQWDGTLLDTGEPLPDATYYYVLTLDGKLFKGYVYINRVK
jgi:gliding motility-associated-like protein